MVRFSLYENFEIEFIQMLTKYNFSFKIACYLSKLAKSLLIGDKTSISYLNRVYFPDISITSLFHYLSIFLKRFQSLNQSLIRQIISTWKPNQLAFVICDDYLIPRLRKRGYRVGKFRDPVQKKIRYGHNVVNIIIANINNDLGFIYGLHPKNARIKRTQRGLKQIKQAVSLLLSAGRSKQSIRLLMDGGYTNTTVLLPIKNMNIKYIGVIQRTRIIYLFGQKYYVQDLFDLNDLKYISYKGKKYYYIHKIFNLKLLGRHKFFLIFREYEVLGKFYLTNDLKMSIYTFIRFLSIRWLVEQHHRDLNQKIVLKHLFVRKRKSVLGLISLMYFAKNFIVYLLAKQGIFLRNYPFESINEKEFQQIDQQLINSALNYGLLENLGY